MKFNQKILILFLWAFILLWVGYSEKCDNCSYSTKPEITYDDGVERCSRCKYEYDIDGYESSMSMICIFMLMGWAFVFKKEIRQGHW